MDAHRPEQLGRRVDQHALLEAAGRHGHHGSRMPAEPEREAAGDVVEGIDTEVVQGFSPAGKPDGLHYLPTTPLDSMSSVHLSPRTRPSGSLIDTKMPPCSPVRSGFTTTLTLSP